VRHACTPGDSTLSRTVRSAWARRLARVVIGAGLAGVQCARMLHEHGVDVRVLEKSRAIGGRLASRRVDGHPFAHGAPVVHHTLPFFERLLALLVDDGLLIRLDAERVRALGPMTEWVRRLARPIDDRIERDTRAVRLERSGRGWVVHDERARSWACDAVVLAMPTTQSATLARTALECLDERSLAALERVRYEPTLVVMALFEASPAIEPPFEDALVDHAILRRCVVERVERGGRPCVAATLYAQPSFSAAHEHEGDDGPWTRAMIDAAREVRPWGAVLAQDSKRWRYARVSDERACDDGGAFLSLDRDGTLLVIGDGVADRAQGRDAEASWMSASAAASALLQRSDRGA
jgi:renalase